MIAAAILLAAVEPDPASVERFEGLPRFGSEEGWSIRPRGRLQYDLGWVGRPEGVPGEGFGFGHDLRRLRLGFEGTMPGDLGFTADLDLAGDRVEVVDANLNYRPAEGLTITFGQHNNFQALEELTSSRFTSFLERAAFTDAYGHGRRFGLSAAWTRGAFTAQGGVFAGNVNDWSNGIDEGRGIDLRAIHAPRLGSARLHVAASLHLRDYGRMGGAASYSQRPLTEITDIRFLEIPEPRIARETGAGLEAAIVSGPFHAVAEAQWLAADLVGPAPRATFFGGYAEIGWFLTGETRGYRGARWDRTQVRRVVEEGGIGAVQINLRYDRLDLDDGAIRGGAQDGLIAGIVWIPTDHVRFLANYAWLSYRRSALAGAGGGRDHDVEMFAIRGQIDF